jgi:chaperone BCS1
MFEGIDIKSMLPTLIGVYGITMLSTAWKGLGIGLFRWLQRRVTTTIRISNMSWMFYTLMNYFERMKTTRRLRDVWLLNGRYGDEMHISIGFGTGIHIVKMYGKTLIIRVNERDIHKLEDKLSMTITVLGRDNSFAFWLREKLLEEIGTGPSPGEKIPIYEFGNNYWGQASLMERRMFDTVFIPSAQKKRILDAITDFDNSKPWFMARGIPYHLGILIYGPPGSGKTSVIRAIASQLNKCIYVLQANRLEVLPKAVAFLPKNTIFVIEDIDSSSAVRDPDDTAPSGEDRNITVNVQGFGNDTTIKPANLSTVLNTLDGIGSSEGRIMILTTNHIERLSPALLRPGRIDLLEKIDFITINEFTCFLSRYYDMEYSDVQLNYTAGRKMTDTDVTVATVQNYYMLNKPSIDEIINNFTIAKEERGNNEEDEW